MKNARGRFGPRASKNNTSVRRLAAAVCHAVNLHARNITAEVDPAAEAQVGRLGAVRVVGVTVGLVWISMIRRALIAVSGVTVTLVRIGAIVAPTRVDQARY